MPTYISRLDNKYISLKSAAELLAKELSDFSQAEIMEMFTHALFVGEFERALDGAALTNEWLLPLVRIEAPRRSIDIPRLPLESGPQEYLPAKAITIAEVLIERDAAPGTPEDWRAFSQGLRTAELDDHALRFFAHIPYGAFPPEAQALLGGIVVAKETLHAWMTFKGYELPEFLKNVTAAGQLPSPDAPPDDVEVPTEASRGRPQKAAWLRIKKLIRDMHTAAPQRSRYALAFDAHEKAKTEFDEKDLPSVGTIYRQMKNILRPET